MTRAAVEHKQAKAGTRERWAKATGSPGFFPPVNLLFATVPFSRYANKKNKSGSSATVSGYGAERLDDPPDNLASLWTNLLRGVKDCAQAGPLK